MYNQNRGGEQYGYFFGEKHRIGLFPTSLTMFGGEVNGYFIWRTEAGFGSARKNLSRLFPDVFSLSKGVVMVDLSNFPKPYLYKYSRKEREHQIIFDGDPLFRFPKGVDIDFLLTFQDALNGAYLEGYLQKERESGELYENQYKQ